MSSEYEKASFANLLPTPLLHRTALAMVSLPFIVFPYLSSELARLSLTSLEKHFLSLLGAVVVALLCALVLVFEACRVLHKTREKRVVTRWSNQHPHMTWRWLVQNAEVKHVLVLLLYSLCILGLGIVLTLYKHVA